MLLRTVVLLLLCVSTGMCASLVSFQIQQKEREKDSQDLTEESAVVADAVVTAVEAAVKEGEAAAVDQASDTPLVDQASDTPVVDQASDTLVVDQASDTPVVDQASDTLVVDQASDTPVVDQASDTPLVDQASDTPVVDQASDKPVVDQASDAPAEQVPENLLEETLAVDKPNADTHKVNEAGVPGEDGDRSAGDTPAVEAVGVIQKLPSSAEEDNEIKPVQTKQSTHRPSAKQNNSTWGLHSIRNSFQAAHGYFDSLVELVGGHDGVCQYRCRYGGTPQPRPGYQVQEPNGCSSSLVGMKVNAALDLGIPAMTECCNQIDVCYDSCGTSKYDCDLEFRSCLHDICSHLKKSLGFVSQVQACESVADVLYNTVWTLGCRPYMNSQRAACVCDGEERDEL